MNKYNLCLVEEIEKSAEDTAAYSRPERAEFFNNLKRCLDEVSKELQNCDAFQSFNGLNFLMRKHSINKRFQYFLLRSIKEPRARN